MKNMRIDLLIIDPQNDFMDSPGAALAVPGANDDMDRLAALVDRVSDKLFGIHVTLDSHRVIDVAHGGMWRNVEGDRPEDYTNITYDKIKNGEWTPRNPAFRERMLTYVKALEDGGNYPLMVWPEHCLIGSEGHNVQANLASSLQDWERKRFLNVNYVTKGTNTFTEHYGALQAEVPDPNDPSTALNVEFLNVLSEADMIVIAGEALSHCVKSTVSQIADNIGPEHLKKFYLLTDCSSPVAQVGDGPDFPAIAADWLKEMEARGMNLATSVDFLK